MSITKQEIAQTPELEQYVTDVLSNSRRRLGSAILHSIDRTRGRWFVWAPGDRSPPNDFSTGGLFRTPDEEFWMRTPGVTAVPIPNAREFLADELFDFLQRSPEHICILSNEITDVGDPFFSRLPARVTFEGDVYHLLRREMSRDEIFATIKRADSIPIAYGLLSSIDSSGARGDQLSLDEYRSLVENAAGFYVRAFDGESYLVFSTIG